MSSMGQPMMQAQGPPQMGMGGPGGGANSGAMRALWDCRLVSMKYSIATYDKLIDVPEGSSEVTWSLAKRACVAPCCGCCGFCNFVQVDHGCVTAGTQAGGIPVWFGQGFHERMTFDLKLGESSRVSKSNAIINGTAGIMVVREGYCALLMKSGEPVILPPGLHQWDNPDVLYIKNIDLGQPVIQIGPYTLVTVEEGYVAITQDNGKQNILQGGQSYVLTHQNWTFQGFLCLKMQTISVGPVPITTGDNIPLAVTANVNWAITDALIAARRNVDTRQTNGKQNDPLAFMTSDVKLQIASSLAALIGNIKYGSQGNKSVVNASDTGKVNQEKADDDDSDDDKDGQGGEEGAGQRGRLALYDKDFLGTAVNDANNITSRYGVQILSVNIVSAAPADYQLQNIMASGAKASMYAQELAQNTRSDENASLIEAEMAQQVAEAFAEVAIINAGAAKEVLRIKAEAEKLRAKTQAEVSLAAAGAEAESTKILAAAEGEAERIRGLAAKEAGLALEASQVATSLAKMKLAYEPFKKQDDSTFFFGLQGNSQPTAGYLPGYGA